MTETIKKGPCEETEPVANWLRNRRQCHEIKEVVIKKTTYIPEIKAKTEFLCKWIKINKNEWERTIGRVNKENHEKIKLDEKTLWNIIYDNIKWSKMDKLYISIKY